MRNRESSTILATVCFGFVLVTASVVAGVHPVLRPGEGEALVPAARSPMAEPPQAPVPAAESLQDQVYPLPTNVEIREFVVGVEGGVRGAVVGTSRLVYSNKLGPAVFGPSESLASARIADDITTTAANWCNLDRYVIMVSGDRRGDGSGVGPFNVDVALYGACPGARGAIIPGTAAHVDFPDNGTYTLVVVIPPDVEIPIPSSLYLGLSFSRDKCGVVVGAPPTMGFSADRFDFPGFPCAAGFGGFPDLPHASFYAEIYVREDCPTSFVGYKNTNHAGSPFSIGVRKRFADDVRLGVAECNMVAYEIAHKGDGIIGVDLRSFLSNTDPHFGGVIPGTPMYCWSSGDDVQFCRKEFYKCDGGERDGMTCDPNEPVSQECPGGSCIIASIPLPQDLWVVYQTGSSYVGPLLTCKRADLGWTEVLYRVYTWWQWAVQEFPGQCWSGFDLTIYCEGSPPVGACCDMILKDEAGDAVCRELPEMNCAFPELWEEDAMCESFCVGGVNDGEPCTRWADCPEGTCPGPFDHPCGLSACCKPDDTCENLAENECHAIPPVERRRLWQRGRFCGQDEQQCPFNACLQRVGDCHVARPDAGCANPWCCDVVCEIDPWCCRVAWDRLCVETAQGIDKCYASNDRCSWALPIEVNTSTVIGNVHTTKDATDPGFSCHREMPGARGFHTVWLTFEATQTSARIQTCNSKLPVDDSILAVYRVGDPSTPETACASLEEIACNDDKPGCGTGYTSQICVTDLVPGKTYYIQLASRSEEGGGVHQLDIESPCPPSPRPDCPTGEVFFFSPPDGVVDARRSYPHDDPYDLEGIDTVLVEAPVGAGKAACWTVCETPHDGPPNDIVDVVENGAGTFITISLERAITPGALTGVTYTDNDDVKTTGLFTAHPANVNADSMAAPGDILYLIDVLNGVRTGPWGHYSTDCDHSGQTTPADVLCVIDLLNGRFVWGPAWNNTPLPTYDLGCYRTCGVSTEIECRERDFCKFPDGECQVVDNLGICTFEPTICPDEYDLVCGCDGVTYSNECYADAAGVSLAYRGACERVCSSALPLLTCEDEEFCRFPEGQCDIAENVGTCTGMPMDCPEDYNPVCGCDGVTYDNECLSDAAGVSIDYRNECEP